MTTDFNSPLRSENEEREMEDRRLRLPDPVSPTPENTIVINRTTFYYAITAMLFFIAGYIVAWAVISTTSANNDVIRAAVSEAMGTAIAGIPVGSNGNAAAQQVQAQPTLDTNKRYTVAIVDKPTLGPESALVTVIEFSDFQCPFCGRFAAQTEQALLKKYEGKIRFVYRDFPLDSIHPFARGAAEAAACAYEQKKFWEYHDLLFQNQDKLTKDDLSSYAKQVGLNVTAFQTCVDSGKYQQEVANDYQAAIALGLSGTPTFFVNGRILVGAQPLSAFTTYIDAELASLNAPAAATTKTAS